MEEDYSQYASPKQESSEDFSSYAQPKYSDETFGEALKAAPGRIASDVGSAALKGLNALPKYWNEALTEVPAFLEMGSLSEIAKNPLRALHTTGQALAGVNEGINALAQIPLEISRYGSERLNITPQSITNLLQKVSPEDTSESINQLFSQPQYPGEAMLRGIPRNALNLVGAGELANIAKPFLSGEKTLTNALIKPHDLLENKAESAFNHVAREVDNRGIAKVPIDSHYIESLRRYFPETPEAETLLNAGKEGDFHALRKIQSDLYTEGKKSLGSDVHTERMKGNEMMNKRDKINESISNHLKNSGHEDLSNALNNARNDYKTLKKVYYNEHLPNSVIQMFDKDIRKIPENINVFKENSRPMQALRDLHPGFESNLKKHIFAKNVFSNLKTYGLTPAALFGAYEAGKHI